MTPLDFFLAHRVPVFPIQAGSKTPAVPKGTHWNAWDDFARPRPTSAYGVVLGALIVIDADSPASAAWVAAHVPSTPFTVMSGPYHDGAPGRGCHHYFRAPTQALPAFIRRDDLVIEVRRSGQYVLGPNSPHPTGCTYTASPWSWRMDDLPTFPADFVFTDEAVVPSPATTDSYVRYEPPPAPWSQGARTYELFRLLRHLKANGATLSMAREIVVTYNRARCVPPKTDRWLNEWFGRSWNHRDRADFNQSMTFIEPSALFEEDGL